MNAKRWQHAVAVAGGLAVALTSAFPAPLAADDRDFVRTSVAEPYVFFILDTSGSFNWTPRCSPTEFAAGHCSPLCDTRDTNFNPAAPAGECYAPMQADDPGSKAYSEHSALWDVVNSLSNVQLGFATFNQDQLNVANKHWMYTVGSTGITLQDGEIFPALGANESFGRIWPCTSGDNTGCSVTTPAATDDAWGIQRMQQYAKLGDLNNTPTAIYIKTSSDNRVYRVVYSPNAGVLGAPVMSVTLTVVRCNNTACDSNTPIATKNLTYNLTGAYISWEFQPNRAAGTSNGFERGFFNQGDAEDSSAGNSCAGWDPNTDSGSDANGAGYDLRFPTVADPLGRGADYAQGDIIPWDWLNNHKTDLLNVFAPTPGGYDLARYFNDHPINGENFLRLKDPTKRPLVTWGATPLGASIANFKTWYDSWKVYAAAHDPNWACRRKYVVVVTDGYETCGGLGTACNTATSLRVNDFIRTYVVAYGVPPITNPTPAQIQANALTCMAFNGGTGTPFFPENRTQLVDALTAIFGTISEEERSFASAAVPSVQADVKDKIFLSDFTPIQGVSIWDGHLFEFLKPLPLKTDGSGDPNLAAVCTAGQTSNCLVWDAGAQMVTQAPTPTEAASGNYHLGFGTNQRRLLYPNSSGQLLLFQPPAADPAWIDLFGGLGFADVTANAANKARATNIIAKTLQQKTATITSSAGTFTITYVMGDVFHSDPAVLDSPASFLDFTNDSFGLGRACDLTVNSDPGFKCFSFKHQFRRKLVFVGTDDAQWHALDGGVVIANTDPAKLAFANGSGLEAFGLAPRLALPILREDAEKTSHVFGMDGPISEGDVHFAGDGLWHSVIVGGTREGGRKLSGGIVQQPESGVTSASIRGGYVALDVTQPDPITSLTNSGGAIISFVPADPFKASSASADPKITSVPGCTSTDGITVQAGCPRVFPKLLWEFTDRSPTTGAFLDENRAVPGSAASTPSSLPNGSGDLGNPWSKPVITRIRLVISGSTQTRFVAIFGGGLDPNNKTAQLPSMGNFIYILDIETGQVIYKMDVLGSVPAATVLDANNDGFADTIYFGTTAGFVYKMDISTPQPLVSTTVKDVNGTSVSVPRVTAAAWAPFRIFQTGNNGSVYMTIETLFVQSLGRYALVFGTGDRENLWNFDGINGRVYVIIDDGWTSSTSGLPFTESSYTQVTPDGAALSDSTNLLTNPGSGKLKGWYMLLDPSEKLITRPFGLSGILTFSSFQPQVTETGGQLDVLCAHTGTSRNFVVFTTNGNPVADLFGGPGADRYFAVSDFVTSPFVEQTQTQNQTGPETGNPAPDTVCTQGRLGKVTTVLKGLGPANAHYGNFFLRIGQRESKRGLFYPACVPIAIMERNWKEN